MTWTTLNEHTLRYDDIIGLYIRPNELGFCLKVLLKSGEVDISDSVRLDTAQTLLRRARFDLEQYEKADPKVDIKQALLELADRL